MLLYQLKKILPSITGNIIEWYDFGLFMYLVPLYAKLFFSPTQQSSAILMIFSVFASGFMVRPLGALFFGYRGDKYGRSKTISLTLKLISLSSLLTVCLPTYQSIGSVATLLFISQRFLQGLSIGGEYAGSIVYLVEVAPEKRTALFSSFCNVGSNIGVLLAAGSCALLAHCLSEATFNSIGWRIPYIFGALAGLLMIRRVSDMQESTVFRAQQSLFQAASPLRIIWQEQKCNIIKSAGLVVLSAAGNYTLTSYLNTYLQTSWGYSLATTMTFQTIFLLLSLVMIPVCGVIADYVSPQKLLSIAAIGYLALSVPCFLLIGQLGLIAFLPIMLLYFMEQGSVPATVVLSSPIVARYSQVSIGYNITMSFVGGFTPLMNAWLVATFHHRYLPGCFLMCAGAVTLAALYFNPVYQRQYETEEFPLQA